MNQLALMTILEYREQSLELCKRLLKENRDLKACKIILELLEKNLDELKKGLEYESFL